MNGTGDDRSDQPIPRRVKRALSFSTPSSEQPAVAPRPVGTSPTGSQPHHPHRYQHHRHNPTHEAARLTTDNKDTIEHNAT